jgi:hypothetical protein
MKVTHTPTEFKEGRSASQTTPVMSLATALKNWVMTLLAFIFTLLYAAALAGWLIPLPDDKMVARIEPIIFVIIGYYFGRLPAQQNEQTLKQEIHRQAQRADATQHAKEQIQQVREALEEKIKNVKITLASSATGAAAKSSTGNAHEAAAPSQTEALRLKVANAIELLNS